MLRSLRVSSLATVLLLLVLAGGEARAQRRFSAAQKKALASRLEGRAAEVARALGAKPVRYQLKLAKLPGRGSPADSRTAQLIAVGRGGKQLFSQDYRIKAEGDDLKSEPGLLLPSEAQKLKSTIERRIIREAKIRGVSNPVLEDLTVERGDRGKITASAFVRGAGGRSFIQPYSIRWQTDGTIQIGRAL